MTLSALPWRAAMALTLSLLFSSGLAKDGPDLLLLKSYQDDMDPVGWLMSEKLDGVRAFWTGKQLLSRGGAPFAAPAWFTDPLPPFPIDGELWTRRGDFERISSITRKSQPHAGWREITYNIFEVPSAAGGLLNRLGGLEDWLARNPVPHIHVIPQTPCEGREHLRQMLKWIEAQGGEGLVLRNPDAPYRTGRDPDSLKVKSFADREAKVIGYKPGKGKYAGMVGALHVELPDGKRFYIGTGLKDADRKTPPPIGSRVTFKYQGYTKKGLPRFPSFLRVRNVDVEAEKQ